jgi:hypothetical protein
VVGVDLDSIGKQQQHTSSSKCRADRMFAGRFCPPTGMGPGLPRRLVPRSLVPRCSRSMPGRDEAGLNGLAGSLTRVKIDVGLSLSVGASGWVVAAWRWPAPLLLTATEGQLCSTGSRSRLARDQGG